jgi:hypothetical protein
VDPGVEGSNPFTHPTLSCIPKGERQAMEKEQVAEKITSVTKEGKISCRQALGIARDMDLSPKELGDLLNEMKIKIASCQLGCFP